MLAVSLAGARARRLARRPLHGPRSTTGTLRRLIGFTLLAVAAAIAVTAAVG